MEIGTNSFGNLAFRLALAFAIVTSGTAVLPTTVFTIDIQTTTASGCVTCQGVWVGEIGSLVRVSLQCKSNTVVVCSCIANVLGGYSVHVFHRRDDPGSSSFKNGIVQKLGCGWCIFLNVHVMENVGPWEIEAYGVTLIIIHQRTKLSVCHALPPDS